MIKVNILANEINEIQVLSNNNSNFQFDLDSGEFDNEEEEICLNINLKLRAKIDGKNAIFEYNSGEFIEFLKDSIKTLAGGYEIDLIIPEFEYKEEKIQKKSIIFVEPGESLDTLDIMARILNTTIPKIIERLISQDCRTFRDNAEGLI